MLSLGGGRAAAHDGGLAFPSAARRFVAARSFKSRNKEALIAHLRPRLLHRHSELGRKGDGLVAARVAVFRLRASISPEPPLARTRVA